MTERRPSRARAYALRWTFIVVLLLAAWALRLCRLADVPPGWRDDELINMYALSGEVLSGSYPLYFEGASGHEPLFHYLQAGLQSVLGYSVLSGHLLPASLGVLSVALTYVVAVRLFGRVVASLASLALATSFWSLMYSRVGLRHISVVPLALVSIYLLYRAYQEEGGRTRTYVLLGLAVGVSMYTYFASRLLPLVIAGFLVYLLALHREAFWRQWRGLLLSLGLAAVVVAPMGLAIVRGVGSDPRVAELAGPLRAAMTGDPLALVDNTLATLGMFTHTGDPEWLYNLPGRPVLSLLGGLLMWVGVVLCLARFRRAAYFLLVWWFAVGLAPAFVSIPPASLGHTILAMPATFILIGLAIHEIGAGIRRLAQRHGSSTTRSRRMALIATSLLSAAFLISGAYRDLADYFVTWPSASLVRFLYRADYRDIVRFLRGQPGADDAAAGGTLLGPWDRLALETDSKPDGVAFRVFDPDRALVWPSGANPPLALLTQYPPLARTFTGVLNGEDVQSERIGISAKVLELPSEADPLDLLCGGHNQIRRTESRYANGLVLEGVCWLPGRQDDGEDLELVTVWRVDRSLDLPEMPVVANPPPPGVYSGPRLAAFVHLSPGGDQPALVDDGMWVDPLTLRAGDRFAQLHRFPAVTAPLGEDILVAIGLYDPSTGDRVRVVGSEAQSDGDRIVLEGFLPAW